MQQAGFWAWDWTDGLWCDLFRWIGLAKGVHVFFPSRQLHSVALQMNTCDMWKYMGSLQKNVKSRYFFQSPLLSFPLSRACVCVRFSLNWLHASPARSPQTIPTSLSLSLSFCCWSWDVDFVVRKLIWWLAVKDCHWSGRQPLSVWKTENYVLTVTRNTSPNQLELHWKTSACVLFMASLQPTSCEATVQY